MFTVLRAASTASLSSNFNGTHFLSGFKRDLSDYDYKLENYFF